MADSGALMMSSLMGMGGQGIIMKEIVSILNSFRQADAGTGIWVILTGIVQIIVVIAVYRLAQNPEIMTEYLRWIGWIIFRRIAYRSFRISHTSGLGSLRANFYNTISPNSLPFNLPMLIEICGDETTVSYIPWIHDANRTRCETLAQKAYESSQKTTCTFHQWSDSKYAPVQPIETYPSRNCLQLQAIIERCVLVCSRLRQYKPICLSLNGEPGLGKTASVHFIASQHSVRNIYRCDLSSIECLDADMETMFQSMYHEVEVSVPTIFLIDEIDKWLDYQVSSTYSDFVAEQKSNENISPPSKEEYSAGFRSRFLHLLLAIAERSTHSAVCIVIFACNNFDSIFDGVSMQHFHSLRDRFQPLTFERCCAEEIRDYLRYVNDRLDGTVEYVPELESILETIPEVSITYRRLHGLAIVKQFDPAQISYALQEMISEDEVWDQSPSNVASSSGIQFQIPRHKPFQLGKRSLVNNEFRANYCKSCNCRYIPCNCGDRTNDHDLITACHFCHAKIDFPPLKARNFIPFSMIQSTTLRHFGNAELVKLLQYANQDDVVLSLWAGSASFRDQEKLRINIVHCNWTKIPSSNENAILLNSVFKKWDNNLKSDNPLLAPGIKAMTAIMNKTKTKK